MKDDIRTESMFQMLNLELFRSMMQVAIEQKFIVNVAKSIRDKNQQVKFIMDYQKNLLHGLQVKVEN